MSRRPNAGRRLHCSWCRVREETRQYMYEVRYAEGEGEGGSDPWREGEKVTGEGNLGRGMEKAGVSGWFN